MAAIKQQKRLLLHIFVALATLFNDVLSKRGINLDFKKDKVHIGDDWTMRCHVTVTRADPVLIKIFKTIGSEEYEIAVNNYMNEQFKDTGRYSHELQTQNSTSEREQSFLVTLAISNVQAADTGKIGCAIPSLDIAKSKKLTVYSPIEEITLTMGIPGGDEFKNRAEGQTLEYTEGEVQTAMCRVKGGYPAPTVVMTSGDIPITDQFDLKQESVSYTSENPPGLSPPHYRTSLLKEEFNITYSLHDKILRCSAKVPKSGFDEVSQQFRIHLTQYLPKVNCGAFIPSATIGKPYSISCVVSGLPVVNNINVYNDKGKGIAGDRSYKVDVQPTATDEKTKVTLKIDKVAKTHLRTYIFEAENELGVTKQQIHIRKRRPKPSSSKSMSGTQFHKLAISPYFAVLLVAMVTKIID